MTPTPTEPPPVPPPPPPPPPPVVHSEDEVPHESVHLKELEAMRFELALGQISPEYVRPKAFVATAGIDYATIVGESPIGFAMVYGAAIGITSKLSVPFDLRVGAGFGLRFLRFRLIPIAGIGTDTMGGGSDDSFKVPLAFYWFVEARLRAYLFSGIALEGIAAHQVRGSIGGDPNLVGDENRITALLSHRLDGPIVGAIGFRYIDYRTATTIGGVAAVTF
jgi:hypothetical protein